MRNKSNQIKNNDDKTKEIENLKTDISRGIKTKLIKSFTPKESFYKKFDFSSASTKSSSNRMFHEFKDKEKKFYLDNQEIINSSPKKSVDDISSPSSSEMDSEKENEDDVVDFDSIKLDPTLKKNSSIKTSDKSNITNKKRSATEKRISRGYIGGVFNYGVNN